MAVQALVVDPEAPNAMCIAEVAEPTAGPTTALIDVHHVSLNRGDLNDAGSGRVPPGGVLGSDAAGVVAEAAREGSGPKAGRRVVALRGARSPSGSRSRSTRWPRFRNRLICRRRPRCRWRDSPPCGRCAPQARCSATAC